MPEIVGKSIPRIDGAEKVTGRAVYTSDLKPPGMVHAKILRSPLPHARIRRIDSSKAASFEGVVAVLTRDNLNVSSPYYGAYIKDQPIVALEKVRYEGTSSQPWRPWMKKSPSERCMKSKSTTKNCREFRSRRRAVGVSGNHP